MAKDIRLRRRKMHTKNRRTISILLSLAVMFSMCFAGTTSAFAESEEEQGNVIQQTEPLAAEAEETFASEELDLDAGELEAAAKDPANADYELVNYMTIKPTNFESSTENVYYVAYSNRIEYTIYFDMPSAGTLILTYLTQKGSEAFLDKKSGGCSLHEMTTKTGAEQKFYSVSAKRTVRARLLAYPDPGSDEVFAVKAQYAPLPIPASTKWNKYCYYLGTGIPYKAASFKVKVPSNGYLMMDLLDGDSKESINYKTSGYKGYERLTLKDFRRVIGVKKGTYTFYVKSYAATFKIRVKFTPVKESKYGTSRKKARAIKKNKTAKALMITNAKKTHWYKFKNKKLQKVSVVIDTKISKGSSAGGLKVTIYDKKRQIYTRKLYPGAKPLTVKLTSPSKKKLKKGTYYIKVESYNGGNGYFTVKWK